MLSFGFFDSIDGDRVYNADQFSSFLDGIIYDGVYQSVGEKFYVSAFSGMTVSVGSGRAWLDHTWTLNTSPYIVTLPISDTVFGRYDAIVIEVNKNDRENYIKYVQGTPSAVPSWPSMTRTDYVKQYVLAYIYVGPNVGGISQADITYMVGEDLGTPLVSALALAGIPTGGTIGQVLAKTSNEPGACGWFDVEHTPFDKWYLADGVGESSVIAAYKFIGRTTESVASHPISEYANLHSNFDLSKSGNVTWDTTTGFYIPGINSYVDNYSLRQESVQSIVLRVNGINYNSNYYVAMPLTGNWPSDIGIWLKMPYVTNGFMYWATPNIGVTHGNEQHFHLDYSTSPASIVIDSPLTGALSVADFYSDGIFGYTKDGDAFYRNGTNVAHNIIPYGYGDYSGSYGHTYIMNGVPRLLGGSVSLDGSTSGGWDDPDHWQWSGSFYCSYLALYSVKLTPSQHEEIAGYIATDAAAL